MSLHTALHAHHLAAGARMVDFGGWDMPLHYGSQLDEHHAVRRAAGVFDVSHMTVVDITGAATEGWLRGLLANDVARRPRAGQGLYSCMLNEQGGVIDDLIAYRRGPESFRLVVNASTREQDLAWLSRQAAGHAVALVERPEAVMLAVQGPDSRDVAARCLPDAMRDMAGALQPFEFAEQDGLFVARTGYTGEDGWELIFADAQQGLDFWDGLISAGVEPCGLGARDTLRLEAGLALYGQDLDSSHSPLVSGLGWTIAWQPEDRAFVGRAAVSAERDRGPAERLVGLVLEGRGIIRSGQRVLSDAGDGLVTSGGFAPTLQCSVALARVPVGVGDSVDVEIRQALRRARVVKPRFVRQGKTVIEPLNP